MADLMPEAPWVGQWYDKYRNRYYGLTEEPKSEEEMEEEREEKFEQIRQGICELCKYKADYKDPDDLWEKKCEYCEVMDMLDEVQYADI